MDPTTADDDPVRTQCVWMFVSLPIPLPLPHGYEVRQGEEVQTLLTGHVSSGLRLSLKVHQIQRSVSPLMMDTIELMQAAAQATAGEPVTGAAPNLDALPSADILPSTMTIIEVAVPHATTDDVDTVLDEAIETIRHVQESVTLVRQTPMPLMSRAFCTATVPVYVGTIQANEQPTYEEWFPHFVPESALAGTHGVEPVFFTDGELTQFGLALQAVADRHPFAAFADLRRDALDQLYRNGNRRLAVAVLATAAEVFLDTLILVMLWEEGAEPDSAAASHDITEGHAHRVAKNLPFRLGGNWDANGSGAVADYFRDVVYLRHRVVHAGHYPTHDETDRAIQALKGLESFIGDRLCHHTVLNRYTRVALMYLGKEGLSRRERWTAAVARLADDAEQPNWIASHARWRHHFDRATNPRAPEPGQEFGRCIVYLDRAPDGSPRWTVHDPSTCHAAAVDPTDHLDADHIAGALVALELLDDGPERLAVGMARSKPLGFVVDHEVYEDLTIRPGA